MQQLTGEFNLKLESKLTYVLCSKTDHQITPDFYWELSRKFDLKFYLSTDMGLKLRQEFERQFDENKDK